MMPERNNLSVRGIELSDQGIEAYKRADYKAAQSYLEQAVLLGDSPESTWLWLARAQLQLADFESSLASIRKALELRPNWYEAMLHVVEIYSRQDCQEDCLEWLDQIREQHASNPTAIKQVARRLLRLKAYAAAGQAADRLNQLVGDDADAAYVKAFSVWKSGDPTAALQLIERSPQTTVALVRLCCQINLKLGDSAEAWSVAAATGDDVVGQKLLMRIANALRQDRHDDLAALAQQRIRRSGLAYTQLSDADDIAAGFKTAQKTQWHPTGEPRKRVAGIPGRILHIVGRSVPYAQTGYTIRTHSVACAQRESGLDPHVVTRLGFPWGQGITVCNDVEHLHGVPYYRLRVTSDRPTGRDERWSRNVEELVKLAQRLKPSVLHAASNYVNAQLALEAGQRLGLPVVYEVRGFWEETWLSQQNDAALAIEEEFYVLTRARELQCMLSAQHVVTLAETMKREMVQRGVPAKNITVISNAVDTNDFVPQERDNELAIQLGIAPGEVVVGYISSFVGYEGIRFLIDAVAKLLSRGIKVRALLVGDGESEILQTQAAELGIADRVIFTGRVPHDDVLNYYGLIDLFVVPRTNDRVSQLVTPLKPYEAMATGRALIVSRVPALCEMVEEGVNGMTFQPEDADDLAAVLQDLIENPQRRKALGQSARQWVCQHRTWKQNGELYAELYRSLGVA